MVGFASIVDTDGGVLDGDARWDRAVGPMRFIPSTWQLVGRDGNGDGIADPFSIDDAALSAAAYLCARAVTSPPRRDGPTPSTPTTSRMRISDRCVARPQNTQRRQVQRDETTR